MFFQRVVVFISGIFILNSCVSGRLLMNVEPPVAEIRVIDNLVASRATNAGKIVGKGRVSLQKTEYSRKLFLLSAPGHDSLAMFIPEIGAEEQVKITLPKQDGRLAQEAAALRSDLEAERKANALLKEQILNQSNARHSIGRQLVQLQKWIVLTMAEDAEIVAGELFKLPEDLLPAAAFTLRAKLRIIQGRVQEAKADIQKALSLSTGDTEATALLESLR
jgi:hypothetical protein